MSTDRPEPASVLPPSRHQLALSLGSVLADLPTVPGAFVLATVAVPVVMYGLMPRLHRLRVRPLVLKAG